MKFVNIEDAGTNIVLITYDSGQSGDKIKIKNALTIVSKKKCLKDEILKDIEEAGTNTVSITCDGGTSGDKMKTKKMPSPFTGPQMTSN